MTNESKSTHQPGNGGYERSDIGATGILYFLLGLAVAGLFVYIVVAGLYSYMNKQSEAQQTPLNPLVTNAPADTRKLSVDYKDYLKQNFPNPQLEIDEHTEVNKDRIKEEQTLSTYDYVDKNAGTVRIPIDRAMDLIAQRGLPVRAQSPAADSSAAQSAQPDKMMKGSKK